MHCKTDRLIATQNTATRAVNFASMHLCEGLLRSIASPSILQSSQTLAQRYEHNFGYKGKSRKESQMKQNRKRMVASTALLCILCAGLAFAESSGKKVKVNGLITGRDGDKCDIQVNQGLPISLLC